MSGGRPAAILAGATGLVGEHLLRELTCREDEDGLPAYRRVTVLTRRSLVDTLGWHSFPTDGDVEVVPLRVDFSHLHRVAGELAGDHVFCALGTTIRKARSRNHFRQVDFDYPLTLARLARDAGARHFSLVSSIGADPRARSFYLKVKGETEQALQAVGYPSVSILRPSIIGGSRREPRPLEAVGRLLFYLAPGRYRTVHARAIARCMVTLALQEAPGVRVVESEEIRASVKH